MGLIHRFLTNLPRAILALLLAAAIVALASAALYVTSAPPVVSLLVEPISLLLLPGLLVALVAAEPHDFTAMSVLVWSMLVYTPVSFFALRRWTSARMRRRTR